MSILDWISTAGIRITDGLLILILVLSIIEITPIKLNPWSKLASWFGKMLSAGMSKQFTKIDNSVNNLETKIDKLSDDIETVDKKVKDLMVEVKSNERKDEEREIIQARIRILCFCDELQEGKRHSKDRFDQAMSDITAYEHYCEMHPDFKNNQTAYTIKYIESTYQEKLRNHDFL